LLTSYYFKLAFFFLRKEDNQFSSIMGNTQQNGENLLNACEDGRMGDVRALVTTGGACVDYQDEDGCTPAMNCCMNGHPEVLQVGKSVSLSW
jgi:hypothetical protein